MYQVDGSRDHGGCASIALIAVDRSHDMVGVALAGRGPAVGATALTVLPGRGILVRQAHSDGRTALQVLPSSQEPTDLSALLRDCLTGLPHADEEQIAVGMLDGRIEALQGERCPPWSGLRRNSTALCCARHAFSPATAQAALEEYTATRTELAGRLVQGLIAAQSVEGGRRRMRSAALLVLGAAGPELDLRVDDHARAVDELRRIYSVHRFHAHVSTAGASLPLTRDLVIEVQTALQAGGYLRSELSGIYDASTSAALERWMHDEHLDRRFRTDASIDAEVLEYLRGRNWR